MALRVVIVDDSDSFLCAARVLLEREGLTVVAAVSTTAQALREVERQQPDVVLVDIKLAGESGFECARRLSQHDHGGQAVILISTHAEEDLTDLIAESPAVGFVPKSDLSADAIHRVLRGRPG